MGQLISSEPRVGEPIEEKEDANEDEDEAEIEPEEIEPETVSIWDMGSISSKVDIPEDDKPIIFVIGIHVHEVALTGDGLLYSVNFIHFP
uniref:Uncharacterized protein n=1 Tax=Physcomitrium patens TaxID=3218 RepID=A0A2K1IE73_PHYPA|nr:hypothetical protein PHYPA_029724 [Physcomitrium patens]